MDDIREKAANIKIPTAEDVKDSISRTTNSILEGAENIKSNINNSLNEFSSQDSVNAGKEFLNSNSMIAKVSFIILSVIVFLIAIYLGIRLILYLFSPSRNPYLVKGVLQGNSGIIISQNPLDSNSVYLYKSNDQPGGLEFTWSYWVNINSLLSSNYERIFIKGQDTNTNNSSYGAGTHNTDYQLPGVYLHLDSNQPSMLIHMCPIGTGNAISDISVNNIPMNKWFHTAIRMQNTVVDVYINGTIANRTVLPTIPTQNTYPVIIGGNGGFSGQISNLIYYSHALTTFEINNLILAGPSLTPSQLSSDAQGKYLDYISSSWYNSKL